MSAAEPNPEPLPMEAPNVPPAIVGALLSDQAVSFRDFAAVLGDLRKSGRKPDQTAISQGLQELGSAAGREEREKRNADRDNKIVRLNEALPANEALLQRVHDFESELEEATRQIEQARHHREEAARLREELREAKSREEDLADRLRGAAARELRAGGLREEVHRLRIALSRAEQKNLEMIAEFRHLGDVSEEDAAEEKAEAERRDQETEELRAEAARERTLRQQAEERSVQAEKVAAEIPRLMQEIAVQREALQDLLREEDLLRERLEAALDDVKVLHGLQGDVERLTDLLAEGRKNERELRGSLAEAKTDSRLVDAMSRDLASVRAAVEELSEKEGESTARLCEMTARIQARKDHDEQMGQQLAACLEKARLLQRALGPTKDPLRDFDQSGEETNPRDALAGLLQTLDDAIVALRENRESR